MANPDATARERITAAINDYLLLIRGQRSNKADALGALARALDQLVICYHATTDVEPDTVEGSAAPRVDEAPLIESASAAFPELEWYALLDPQDGPDQ